MFTSGGKCFWASSIFSLVLSSTALMSQELLPMSDDRFLSESDLFGFNAQQLRIARNEIFARHDYNFNSVNLRQHFSQFSWYQPRTKNVSFSSVESWNVEFIKSYETSPALASRLKQSALAPNNSNIAPAVSNVVIVSQGNNKSVDGLREQYSELESELVALRQLLNHQKSNNSEEGINQRNASIAQIEIEINERSAKQAEFKSLAESRYQTAIKPTVIEAAKTPRELSLSFPKVPWYLPEFTDTFGEYWLEPVVSDIGELIYKLRFINPQAENERVTSEFSLSTTEANEILNGLQTVIRWSDIAKEQQVRDFLVKTSTCTPKVQCLEKVTGSTSTQIDFVVLEGGATGARLVRNKGAYSDKFGMSIESAALLASYLDFMITTGEADFKSGSRTDAEIDALFD